MNLNIDKTNIEKLDLDSLQAKSNDALDMLWNVAWLKNAMNKLDRASVESLQETAGKICSQCEVAVIVATGDTAKMIKACTSAIQQREACADVIVFGDSFSPAEYAEVMTDLEKKDFVLISVAPELETVAMRGAFVCLKQLLVTKYGSEKAIDRIYAVAGKRSQLIAEDAAENDYPLISYPDNVPAIYGANTAAALLPMAVKGADLSEYLDGFYDMLASPQWDINGADYGIARAAYRIAGGTKEHFLIWQNQLADFGKWEENFFDGIQKRSLKMPVDSKIDSADAFDTQIIIEEDQEDIMMPYFEGCHEDGSLNLLLNAAAGKYFFENSEKKTGVQISLERLDSYNLGQLMAFAQLSNGITEFLLNN
ncbi:MAG: hypothetical protein ACLRJC_03710 [Emergencia timonensis]|uniref:hypothetical protein n=1 Tax=Emergencia timonensis TaxID=1776384 RepID=UPI000834DCAA|nr:hypothetical protein [Emergencia timonensis]WNX89134.1 hypothetical protein RVY71_02420 [Emergencia timonensis]